MQGCTSAEIAGRLGVMARVLAGGIIQVGDAITLTHLARINSGRDCSYDGLQPAIDSRMLEKE